MLFHGECIWGFFFFFGVAVDSETYAVLVGGARVLPGVRLFCFNGFGTDPGVGLSNGLLAG